MYRMCSPVVNPTHRSGKMKVTVNIPQETLDDLVVRVLKDYHKLCMIPNKIDNSDEVTPPNEDIIDALEVVL